MIYIHYIIKLKLKPLGHRIANYIQTGWLNDFQIYEMSLYDNYVNKMKLKIEIIKY